MNNFEEALALIEALEEENQELKQHIRILSKSDSNIQVTSGYNIDRFKYDADAAMERFTKRMKNDSRKYRKERNVLIKNLT